MEFVSSTTWWLSHDRDGRNPFRLGKGFGENLRRKQVSCCGGLCENPGRSEGGSDTATPDRLGRILGAPVLSRSSPAGQKWWHSGQQKEGLRNTCLPGVPHWRSQRSKGGDAQEPARENQVTPALPWAGTSRTEASSGSDRWNGSCQGE